MFWLLIGAALLTVLLLGLRAFERASVATIRLLALWLAAFGGLALTVLLFISGWGAQALGALVMVGPLAWRRWHQAAPHFSGATNQPPPGRPSSGAMTREEAFEILGLKPGATDGDIQAAHRRLMRMAHPDAGGSDWLASRVNQARDILLD